MDLVDTQTHAHRVVLGPLYKYTENSERFLSKYLYAEYFRVWLCRWNMFFGIEFACSVSVPVRMSSPSPTSLTCLFKPQNRRTKINETKRAANTSWACFYAMMMRRRRDFRMQATNQWMVHRDKKRSKLSFWFWAARAHTHIHIYKTITHSMQEASAIISCFSRFIFGWSSLLPVCQSIGRHTVSMLATKQQQPQRQHQQSSSLWMKPFIACIQCTAFDPGKLFIIRLVFAIDRARSKWSEEIEWKFKMEKSFRPR